MKVRELRRILEGFDNEAEVKVSNVIVEHETVFSSVTDITYSVKDKNVCLVGNGVVGEGVVIPAEDEENVPEGE